ncbi:hypothetical protein Tco_1101217 [Tanacetum coccineum]
MTCYQIIRVDRSSKNYKIFSVMLNDFDRQDVVVLYRLVKERYDTISPEGYDRLLWGDLITLLESSEEDEIWKGQQDYKLISWRLFDSCGVYVLLMDTGIAIHMMVEKKYPLTQEMLSRMLNRRLEVDLERQMFKEGNFDDDFDDINDMVNEAMENVEGDRVNACGAVNTATTGVSAASASVTTAGVSISTVEPRTPPTTIIAEFEDGGLTIAQTLVKMRSKGIMQEPEKPPKNPRKAQIQMDEELAIRLHEEEKDALERMQKERAAQEEASNAALIA